MNLPWFRMYADAIDNAKLRLLAYEDRWHFVGLLCLKSQGILDERNPELRTRKVSIKLGLDSVELETVVKRLVTVGLVSEDMQPLKWNKRQFQSDSSTKRVQQFRERSRNVSVTPPDTDTDTDTEKKAAPKRASRVPESFIPDPSVALTKLPDMDVAAEVQKFRDWEYKTPRSDWAGCWRTWVQNCKERNQYARATKFLSPTAKADWVNG